MRHERDTFLLSGKYAVIEVVEDHEQKCVHIYVNPPHADPPWKFADIEVDGEHIKVKSI